MNIDRIQELFTHYLNFFQPLKKFTKTVLDHGGMSDNIAVSRASQENLIFKGDFSDGELTALDFVFFPDKMVENEGYFRIKNLYEKAFTYENAEKKESFSLHQTTAKAKEYLFSFLVLAVSFIL